MENKDQNNKVRVREGIKNNLKSNLTMSSILVFGEIMTVNG